MSKRNINRTVFVIVCDKSIAAHVGYHSYYLNRLMKSVTGTTIRQYIINYRIEVAKRYLEQTKLGIYAIAELCGYENLSNFSVDFKKKTDFRHPDTALISTGSRLRHKLIFETFVILLWFPI